MNDPPPGGGGNPPNKSNVVVFDLTYENSSDMDSSTSAEATKNASKQKLMDKAFPTVYYPVNRNSKRKPWLSKEILEQGRLLREIHAACKYTMSIELLERYKTLKASHRLKIQVAKKLYHDNTMRNSLNKNKTAWNIIKQHTGGSRTDNQNLDFRKDDGSLLAGKDLADAFNNYFLESVQALTQNININSDSPRPVYPECDSADQLANYLANLDIETRETETRNSRPDSDDSSRSTLASIQMEPTPVCNISYGHCILCCQKNLPMQERPRIKQKPPVLRGPSSTIEARSFSLQLLQKYNIKKEVTAAPKGTDTFWETDSAA
nr:unnamed protein product [Callosobruchus chinensis]